MKNFITALTGVAGVQVYLAGWLGVHVWLVGAISDADFVSGGRLAPEEVGAVGAGLLAAGLVAVCFALRRMRPSVFGDLFIGLHALVTAGFAVWAGFNAFYFAASAADSGWAPWFLRGLASDVGVSGLYVAATWFLGRPVVGRAGGRFGVSYVTSGFGGSVAGLVGRVMPPGLVGLVGVFLAWYSYALTAAYGVDAAGFEEITFGVVPPSFKLLFVFLVFVLGFGGVWVGINADGNRERLLSKVFEPLFFAAHMTTVVVSFVWLAVAAFSLFIPFILAGSSGGYLALFRETYEILLFVLGFPAAYLWLSGAFERH